MKKAIKLLAALLSVIFLFTACTSTSSDIVSKTDTTPKVLTGIVQAEMMNNLTVYGEDENLYTFAKEGVTINGTLAEGAGIEVSYTGTLTVSTETQKVTILKIDVLHEPIVASEPEPAAPAKTADQEIQEIISKMTIEEKVGQLFIARCPTDTAISDIEKYHVGGYILFAKDFEKETKASVKNKIDSFQKAAKIPLLIGVDEEGGTVVRVSRYKQFRATPFWSPARLYEQGGLSALKSDAKEKAVLLKSLGININFAPVCDISTNSSDFIYKRSLGKDAKTTASYVETVVKETLANDMGCMLKHFPGYGNNPDSHTDVVHDNRTLDHFKSTDFVPFEAGIKAGAPAILVAHNIINQVDSKSPASLSPAIHKILRDDLNFDGVIVTDDLSMKGITKYVDADNAAVEAVLAGNDLLTCTNYTEQIPDVIKAVKNGTITEARLDESIVRLLKWKRALNLI